MTDREPFHLVALCGRAGAGKTTVARHMINAHEFRRVAFAGPLKAMLATLGLTDAELNGARKELPSDLLGGATPRRAMQTLGTE